MITTSVMIVTTRRVVQLVPRLTHHSSAQLITTGTMISSCNAPRLVGSARTAAAACSDADSTTDLHAKCGAVGVDETRDSFTASALPMLAHELDASGLAAAPHDGAVAPRSGVARERQPEAGRQHDGVIGRHFRTRCRQILHDALACREAAFEGDPSGLAQLFARVPRLYFSVHVSRSSGYAPKGIPILPNRIGGSR